MPIKRLTLNHYATYETMIAEFRAAGHSIRSARRLLAAIRAGRRTYCYLTYATTIVGMAQVGYSSIDGIYTILG